MRPASTYEDPAAASLRYFSNAPVGTLPRHRGNFLDQDAHAEVQRFDAAPIGSARASSAVPLDVRNFMPAVSPYTRPMSSYTSQPSRYAAVPQRLHFTDNCNVLVEERDEVTGVVRNTFRCGHLLGTGGFAKVFDFINVATGERVACKITDKTKLTDAKKRHKFLAEVDIHRRMNHPNILKFIRCFEDAHYHYILIERCCRQSLMELSRAKGVFNTEEVQHILLQLLLAVDYLHNRRVIHRDLKLGNIMIDAMGNIKVGDFGFATELGLHEDRKKTVCGTPNYIAPEILMAERAPHIGYSFEADLWSVGVVAYTLVVGTPPFETRDLQLTYSRIKNCDYSYPRGCHVSEAMRNLIGWLLQRDPKKRPHMVQIRGHPFFHNHPTVAPMSLVGLDPDLSPQPANEAPSPYAEAGRMSSPIADPQPELSPESPTMAPKPGTLATAEFTPPPAYHFTSRPPTPQYSSPGPNTNHVVTQLQFTPPPPLPSTATQWHAPRGGEPPRPHPGRVMSPSVVPEQQQPTAHTTTYPSNAAAHATTVRKRMNELLKANELLAFQTRKDDSSTTTVTSSSTGLAEDADEAEDDGRGGGRGAAAIGVSSSTVVTSEDADVPPSPVRRLPMLPLPPRVYFTDMVQFTKYGIGFVLHDLRNEEHQLRTVSVGAYLNDKSKLLRDVRDDTVWYFARVREDGGKLSNAAAVEPSPLVDNGPRSFFDQLHKFVEGSAVLDPRSPDRRPLPPFLQSQNVFKKYTIVKFMEAQFARGEDSALVPSSSSPSEEGGGHRIVTSGLKKLFTPIDDIFENESPNANQEARLGEITYVKEAALSTMDALLGTTTASAPHHRTPSLAAARFSDVSFQVTLVASCPAPLTITPQVFGVKGASAVVAWRLDLILYETQRAVLVYRADDDAFAISMDDVGAQRRRGFSGSVVFTPSGKVPSELNGILVPQVCLRLIADMLVKVHCPAEMVALLSIPS